MEHNHFLGMAHHYLLVYFSLLLNLVLPSCINEGGVLSIVLGMTKLWESSRNLFSQVTWGVIGDERTNIDSVHRAQHCGPDLQRDAKLPGRLRPQTLPLKQKMRLHNQIHPSPVASFAGRGEKLSCRQSAEGLKPECLKCPFVSIKIRRRRSRCHHNIRWTAVYWSLVMPAHYQNQPQNFSGTLEVCRCKLHESVSHQTDIF